MCVEGRGERKRNEMAQSKSEGGSQLSKLLSIQKMIEKSSRVPKSPEGREPEIIVPQTKGI